MHMIDGCSYNIYRYGIRTSFENVLVPGTRGLGVVPEPLKSDAFVKDLPVAHKVNVYIQGML